MRDQTAQFSFSKFTEFQKRLFSPPLLAPATAFAAGVWAGNVFEVRFALVWLLALAACLGFLASFQKKSGAQWAVLIFFIAGALHVSASCLYPAGHVKSLKDGKGLLEGSVASFPETTVKGKKRMTRFLMSVENWRIGRTTYQAKGEAQVFIFYAPDDIRYGDRLRVFGELKRPKHATNPEEFNYAAYLEKQGIFKVFNAFGQKSVRFLNRPGGFSWREKIEQLRFLIQQRIAVLFPSPQSEVVQALWLGFRRNIPDEINSAFTKTGTIHLLSISGVHVTLVGGFFYFLFARLGTPRKLNAGLTIVVILFYALIAGGNPPVLRAGLMGILILAGILLEQDSDSWNILVAVFLLFLIWDPKALFLISF